MWSKQKSPRFAVEKPANPAGEPSDFLGVLVAVLPTSSWQAAENTKMTVVELKLSWITLKCKEVSSFPELEEESTEPPFELFGNVWKYHSFQLENSSQHHSPRSSAHPIPIAATTAPRSVRATTIFPAFWTSIPSPSRPPSVSRHGPHFGPFFLGQRMKGFRMNLVCSMPVWLLQLIC